MSEQTIWQAVQRLEAKVAEAPRRRDQIVQDFIESAPEPNPASAAAMRATLERQDALQAAMLQCVRTLAGMSVRHAHACMVHWSWSTCNCGVDGEVRVRKAALDAFAEAMP